MANDDLAFDARLFTDDEGPAEPVRTADIAANFAVYAQATGEDNIALDPGYLPDQAVDTALRGTSLLDTPSVSG